MAVTGPILTVAMIVNVMVGIMLAIDPPWALWQRVGLGVVLGLVAALALFQLTRKP